MNRIIIGIVAITLFACNPTTKKSGSNDTYADFNIVSAMKNVMWKGQLGASIHLDTISNKKGLYAVGPVSYLKGEVLINNGQSYVSRVTSDTSMIVEKTFDVSAPFLVYANVNEWEEIELPPTTKSIKDIEKIVDQKTRDAKRPFAFKMTGKVARATIHIQNLADGATVSSPKEAHQGTSQIPTE